MPTYGSAATFTAAIDKWAEKARADTRAVAIVSIQDLNEEVVARTPVLTGFLRGSWYAGLNGIPTGTGNLDPSGGGVIARVNLITANLKLGDVYFMVNNAVYAKRMENGFVGQDSLGRTYNQPGRAFVRATLNEAPRIAQAAAQRVAAGDLGSAHPGGGGAIPGKGIVE